MGRINASDFRARCLSLLRRVSPTRERCKPSTEPGPATAARATYPQHELEGTVTVLGDIVAPVVSEEDWTGNANAGPTATATPTEP